jgi:hypothetical protein
MHVVVDVCGPNGREKKQHLVSQEVHGHIEQRPGVGQSLRPMVREGGRKMLYLADASGMLWTLQQVLLYTVPPGAHLHDAVQRVEGKACEGAHLVALVVFVVDEVQPPARK